MGGPLLTTKFYFPQARQNLVSRPRLVEKIASGIKSPFLLISAPAGSGKTTLMAEWRSGPGARMPVAWLSLDGDDNDLSRFLLYLASALRELKEEIGASALAILQSSQPPPVQVVLTALINDLAEALPTPFALVLDDYQVIHFQAVHSAVAFLLDHLPPLMRLVILTRADPPLPLPGLRARNRLAELRAADLRFTPEEAAAFLINAMGLKLPAEDITALEERTEGWIAGLQLAALSMQGRADARDFVSAFTGSHHYIVDYLVEEVLNRQPEAVRDFLLKTSVLDRLTAPLCNALTGLTDGQAALDQLEHANLFVIPLDNEQRWYRYHHLFADAIQNRLRQAHPDWLPGLHLRAAAWYEQHGFAPEAIRHALDGEDQGQAARIIEREALSLLTRGELVSLLGWIKAVEPLVDQRPWLCIYRAWALTLSGQLEGVEAWLQEAERHSALPNLAVQVDDQLGHIAAIRAYVAARKGDAHAAVHHARLALQYLPEGNRVVRGAVAGTLGRACWASGDLAGADRAFAEAVQTGQAGGNLYLASGSTCSQADLLCELGRLRAAAETFRQALRLATLPDGRLLPVAGRALAGLSKVTYEWNDLPAAQQFASQAIALCQQWGSADALSIGYVMQARLRQAQGDPDGAREAIEQAVRLARENNLWPIEASWVEAYRLRIWLAQEHNLAAAGQPPPDLSRLAETGRMDLAGPIAYAREIEYLMVARMLLAQGKQEQALALGSRLLLQAEAGSRTGVVIELLLVQALACQAINDLPRALSALERAVSLAQPEGYLRAFLDEGAPLAALLRQARARGIAPGYVARLLAEFEPPPAPPLRQPLPEPLSQRELEILRLVAAGLSNGEIADRLVIARGTVKKHLNNIFGKLGVQTRTQCVARGRALELI